jgi:hypothetical protein
MKYIKKFNEELYPKTYRSAGSKLDYYNKTSQASLLHDFADEREFGFYNMTWANNNPVFIAKESSFTQPKLTGIYYASTPTKYKDEFKAFNGMAYGKDPEMLAEDLVEKWKLGQDGLNISFEFSFKATRETIEKSNRSSNFCWNANNPTAKEVKAFNLQIDLSDWYNGLDDWDADARWDAENGLLRDGEEFTPSTLTEFYMWSASYNVIIKSPNDNQYGIFSDRKSAVKFKNWLITNHLDDIKDAIMNVLRVVGGKSENIEKAVDAFTKIKIQGLYDDDLPTRGGSGDWIRSRWYEKEISL